MTHQFEISDDTFSKLFSNFPDFQKFQTELREKEVLVHLTLEQIAATESIELWKSLPEANSFPKARKEREFIKEAIMSAAEFTIDELEQKRWEHNVETMTTKYSAPYLRRYEAGYVFLKCKHEKFSKTSKKNNTGPEYCDVYVEFPQAEAWGKCQDNAPIRCKHCIDIELKSKASATRQNAEPRQDFPASNFDRTVGAMGTWKRLKTLVLPTKPGGSQAKTNPSTLRLGRTRKSSTSMLSRFDTTESPPVLPAQTPVPQVNPNSEVTQMVDFTEAMKEHKSTVLQLREIPSPPGIRNYKVDRLTDNWEKYFCKCRIDENPCLFDRLLQVNFLQHLFTRVDVPFDLNKDLMDKWIRATAGNGINHFEKILTDDKVHSFYQPLVERNTYPTAENIRDHLVHRYTQAYSATYSSEMHPICEVELKAINLDLQFFFRIYQYRMKLSDDDTLIDAANPFSSKFFTTMWKPCPFYKARTGDQVTEMLEFTNYEEGDPSFLQCHFYLLAEFPYEYQVSDTVGRFQMIYELIEYSRSGGEKLPEEKQEFMLSQEYLGYLEYRSENEICEIALGYKPSMAIGMVPDLALNVERWPLSREEKDTLLDIQQQFMLRHVWPYDKSEVPFTPSEDDRVDFDSDDRISDFHKEIIEREFSFYLKFCMITDQTRITENKISGRDQFFIALIHALDEVVCEASDITKAQILELFDTYVTDFYPQDIVFGGHMYDMSTIENGVEKIQYLEDRKFTPKTICVSHSLNAIVHDISIALTTIASPVNARASGANNKLAKQIMLKHRLDQQYLKPITDILSRAVTLVRK